MEPQTLMDRFKAKYLDNILQIVVSSEDHADDLGKHLHVSMVMKKKVQFTHKVLDDIGGKHGDYKTMKGRVEQAVKYTIKDGVYVSEGFNPTIEAWLETKFKKKNPKENEIVDLIKAGNNIEDLLEGDHRGYIAFRLRATKEIISTLSDIRESKIELPYTMTDNMSPEMNDKSEQLWQGLYDQLTMGRRHRDKHFYIFTETGVGKTVFLSQLAKRIKIFQMANGRPLEGYEDGKYHAMVFEEFGPGSSKLTLINNITGGGRLVDGSTRYNKTVKTDEIPIIIMTNYAPQDIYPNCVGGLAYDAFLTRFHLLRFTVDMPIRIFLDPDDNLQEVDNLTPYPDWVSVQPVGINYQQ